MIFITGINGLVGSFIARQFIQEGYKVRALKRKKSDLSFLKDIEQQIDWIEGDILDIPLLEEATQQAEYVIHCAGVISFYKKLKDEMFKINIEGTANIVNASLKNNVKKFCYLSSVTALGRKHTDNLINESQKWEPSHLNSAYGESKHLAEMEVERGIAEGLNAVIVNPSVVLGPTQWTRSSARLFKYVWDKKPYYTTGLVNYVDVRDVSEAIFQLMTSNVVNERYILNAGAASYKEFLTLIAKAFNTPPPSIEVGYTFLNMAWRIASLLSVFTGNEPIITKETAQASKYNFRFSSDKISETLDLKFRPLEESVQWTCQQLSEYYHLGLNE